MCSIPAKLEYGIASEQSKDMKEKTEQEKFNFFGLQIVRKRNKVQDFLKWSLLVSSTPSLRIEKAFTMCRLPAVTLHRGLPIPKQLTLEAYSDHKRHFFLK